MLTKNSSYPDGVFNHYSLASPIRHQIKRQILPQTEDLVKLGLMYSVVPVGFQTRQTLKHDIADYVTKRYFRICFGV